MVTIVCVSALAGLKAKFFVVVINPYYHYITKIDMRLFTWQEGRQEATKSIQKMAIWNYFGFDIYLLKFPKGVRIGEHLDVVEGKEHHRINYTIKGAWMLMQYDSKAAKTVWLPQRDRMWHKFRPDITLHGAQINLDSLILSIGWTKKAVDKTNV